MYKVVLNRCYGGFGLSPKAEKLYWERKLGKKIFAYREDYENKVFTKTEDLDQAKSLFISFVTEDYGDYVADYLPTNEDFYIGDIPRHDPILVDIVEELKEEANGECAKLVVVEIATPMYRIEDYDGMESIHTPEDNDWIVIETKELPAPESNKEI